MSKGTTDTPVKAIRIPRRKKRRTKRPKRPPAQLPEPIASYEF